MNVDGTLKALLDKLGVPVARLKYNGRAACFITYQLVVGRDTLFSDDEEGAQEYTYQINIYSKTDYFALLQRLKTALKAAGFYGITINAEVYEQDTGYYHVPVEIKYMEVGQMATIGLRDLYRAPITIGTSGAEEYGTPVRMAKAISAELSVEVAEAILYADDGADEVVKEFVSGEITLNVNDLLPADLAALLGQKQDADKVVYGADTDEAPYFAIGFRAKKAGGTYKYIWLYKVKFAVPDENYTTKGDSIEFTTPEIVGQFIKRSDGLWKAEHVAEPTNSVATAWFTTVREPNNAGS